MVFTTRRSVGVEGGDGIVEGHDGGEVSPQSSIPHTLDDLAQLGTIGLDNEVDRQAVRGPCLARPNDGHQRSLGSNQARGPLPDVAGDEIEHQIDGGDIFPELFSRSMNSCVPKSSAACSPFDETT
jgi:hypothetical protein